MKNWLSLIVIVGFAVVMLIGPLLPSNAWHQKSVVSILLAVGFGLTVLSFLGGRIESKNQRSKLHERLSDITGEKRQNENNRPAVIFGGIYTIVNGLGIVKILDDYVKTINDNLANFSAKTFTSILGIGHLETLRLFDFFVTQVPFLHAAVLFLSSRKINEYLPIFIFGALLVHAALFYFIGSNLTNFPLFVFFLWILFTFSTAWLFVLRRLVKELVIPEWIQLNLITAAFLFTYFLYPYFVDSNYKIVDDYSSNLVLMFLLGIRTALDYIFGWKDFYIKV
jgi:hypothetical protein